MENQIFEAIYLHYIFNSKAVKTSLNHDAGLLRFLFIEDSLKIKKCLELVYRPNCSNNFLIKSFLFAMLHKLAKFHYQTVFTFPSYSTKCVSRFMLRCLMTSWNLNIWKFKIWLFQEQNEISKWNKKHIVPCFTRALF